MTNITIIYINVVIIVMNEGRRSKQPENSSFLNQEENPVSHGLPRKAMRGNNNLGRLETKEGNPKAAGLKRQSLNRVRKIELTS